MNFFSLVNFTLVALIFGAFVRENAAEVLPKRAGSSRPEDMEKLAADVVYLNNLLQYAKANADDQEIQKAIDECERQIKEVDSNLLHGFIPKMASPDAPEKPAVMRGTDSPIIKKPIYQSPVFPELGRSRMLAHEREDPFGVKDKLSLITKLSPIRESVPVQLEEKLFRARARESKRDAEDMGMGDAQSYLPPMTYPARGLDSQLFPAKGLDSHLERRKTVFNHSPFHGQDFKTHLTARSYPDALINQLHPELGACKKVLTWTLL